MSFSTLFFDLDHTLLRVNSSYYFGLYLYKKGIIRLSTLANLLSSYLFYKSGFLDITAIHNRSFQALFCGRARREFQQLAEEFARENFTRLINDSLVKHLGDRKVRGDNIVILSSSPDFVVAPFAHMLGVDLWHATRYAVDAEGRFETIEKVLVGKEKALYVQQIISSTDTAFEATVGYTDSIDDVEFLQSVYHPIAVNPSRALRKYCLNRGWEIR